MKFKKFIALPLEVFEELKGKSIISEQSVDKDLNSNKSEPRTNTTSSTVSEASKSDNKPHPPSAATTVHNLDKERDKQDIEKKVVTYVNIIKSPDKTNQQDSKAIRKRKGPPGVRAVTQSGGKWIKIGRGK